MIHAIFLIWCYFLIVMGSVFCMLMLWVGISEYILWHGPKRKKKLARLAEEMAALEKIE